MQCKNRYYYIVHIYVSIICHAIVGCGKILNNILEEPSKSRDYHSSAMSVTGERQNLPGALPDIPEMYRKYSWLQTPDDLLLMTHEHLKHFNKEGATVSTLHSDEREMLVRDLYHQIRNNLQIMCSLQSLQWRSTSDAECKKMFGRYHDRIKSMALIYENVHVSGDRIYVDLKDYLLMLKAYLFEAYSVSDKRVVVKIDVPRIDLRIDTATPCGIIVSELLVNSLLHAFANGRHGEITINAHEANDTVTISIADNGAGFPGDIDYRETSSLGLQIVCCLTEQLDGSLKMHSGGGTTFEVTLLNQ